MEKKDGLSLATRHHFSALPVNLLDVLWDKIYPLLQKPVDVSSGEVTMESIKARIRSGDVLLILVSREELLVAVVTVEIRTFESGLRTLQLPLIGGSEMNEWFDKMLDTVKAIARDKGCQEIRGMSVRKGWMRILEKHGFKEISTVLCLSVGGDK